jgi:phosphopantetheinyl transferase (holo-ACP synthase)
MSDQIAYVGETSGDEFLDVTFYQKVIDDKEVDFINIKVPGDKTVEIDVEVTEYYAKRFARKYAAYQSMQTMTGTPIDDWEEIPSGLRREFNYLGFRFVEQVAGAPDSAFARVMGGPQWRYKAQNYLNRGKINADDLIQQQAQQIAELQKQMAEILGSDTPKRGRKPKEEVPAVTE